MQIILFCLLSNIETVKSDIYRKVLLMSKQYVCESTCIQHNNNNLPTNLMSSNS